MHHSPFRCIHPWEPTSRLPTFLPSSLYRADWDALGCIGRGWNGVVSEGATVPALHGTSNMHRSYAGAEPRLCAEVAKVCDLGIRCCDVTGIWMFWPAERLRKGNSKAKNQKKNQSANVVAGVIRNHHPRSLGISQCQVS